MKYKLKDIVRLKDGSIGSIEGATRLKQIVDPYAIQFERYVVMKQATNEIVHVTEPEIVGKV